MIRVIIVGIITAALAVAIAVTLREDVGLRWFGPDFIAPGADLPEANLGETPPAAPVVHVSREWITVRGKPVASAEEAISEPHLVVEGLAESLHSLAKELGFIRVYRDPFNNGDVTIPYYGPEDELIIQADRDVEFELLGRVLFTCGGEGYVRLNLAAISPETRELEVYPLELPYCGDIGKIKSEADLIVEDDSFRLVYRDASGTWVFNTFEKDSCVLAEELKEMKRPRPGQKKIKILCAARVRYEELIRVIEVLVQPGIALTEIYLTKAIEDLDR